MFHRIAERFRSDHGFGLVEITISMAMLAALAVMFLPVLIQGLKQAAANATLATATQLVNEQIRLAQNASPYCSDVANLAGVASATDPRDIPLQTTTTVGACPGGVGTVDVTVAVVRTDTGQTLTSAQTLVLVE